MDLKLVCLVVIFQISASIADHIEDGLEITWKAIDRNHNGVLESAEFDTEIIITYDKNDDRKISEAEYVAVWLKGYPHQRAAGESVFRQIDINKDGFWTDFDFSHAYKKMDSDRNGNVTETEFKLDAAMILRKAHFVPPTEVIG